MPLPSRFHNDFKAGFVDLVMNLGSTAEHVSNDTGQKTPTFAQFVDPSPQDTALVNALGLEARVVVTLATPTIEKFDTLEPAGGSKVYTVHAVHEILVGDEKIGQRCYVT